MKTLKIISLFCLVGFYSIAANGQSCDPDSLFNYQVKAVDTDSNIGWEIRPHSIFYNPDCTPKNVLLLHLVGTGDKPEESILYPSLAANNGFHTICLKYINTESGKSACGGSLDQDCHYKWRKEIIEGQDYSTEVIIDSVESIYNRLYRLILHMDANFPSQGWGQYISGTEVDWSKLMISGHSQGGGHAAVIAMEKEVQRVIMFASPNDYLDTLDLPTPWISAPHITPDSVYYSFNNFNDALIDYSIQFNAAVELGEDQFGDTVNVDNSNCPYSNSHNLYTDLDNPGLVHNHASMIHDLYVPLDGQNEPIYKEVWEYLLGLGCDVVGLEDETEADIRVFPNPSNGVLSIELAEATEIEVLSLAGKLMYSERMIASGSINLTDFPKGQYLLRMTNKKFTRTEKIVLN